MELQLSELLRRQGRVESQLQDIQNKQQHLDEKHDQIDLRLRHLHNGSTSASFTERTHDKGKDRKRLKERLKKAALTSSRSMRSVGMAEYVFGICPGDQRMGNTGSRYTLPLPRPAPC